MNAPSQTVASTAESADAPLLRFVMVGHVDHGKSTLVGRLIHETGALPDGRYEQILASCERRGMPFEWAFLMDALQAERDQNVTIETTQIWFTTPERRYVMIDAPGHREFLKNMITGAAHADAAILLVDAAEGVQEQTRRHAHLLSLLGMKQIIVAINKMDAVGYDEAAFSALQAQLQQVLGALSLQPAAMVPISARDGEGVMQSSAKMPWYKGASIMQALAALPTPQAQDDLPLRFLVQDVYRFDARRLIAGRIESGSLKVGDTLHFSPAGTVARVKSIECWPEATKQTAGAGESIAITLDTQLFVERGYVASQADTAPPVSDQFHANIFWLGEHALMPGKRYKIKLGSHEAMAEVKAVEARFNPDSYAEEPAESLRANDLGRVLLNTRTKLAMDTAAGLEALNRFVLVEDFRVVGGGTISHVVSHAHERAGKKVVSDNLRAEDFGISREARARGNGHESGVLWFTGLSGSGKSTLARELQRRLFDRGMQVMVLDGDNIRQGLCSDLGFSPEDRRENIRRVAEVASLFADAGFIVITAFISPYREDRRLARAAAPHYFNTIYIKADVETCEGRDVKGLYAKARQGKISEFTGISAPYEEPEHPDLTIDTRQCDIDEAVDSLLDFVETNFAIRRGRAK